MSILTENSVVFVAGHRGMVGSAIVNTLRAKGVQKVVTRTREQLDLIDQKAVRSFFKKEKIDYVVLAAARVGGVHANNTMPAQFIYENLMIESNVIHEAYQAGINRLLLLGSTCIYPKNCPQPIQESHLMTGILEPTNEPYAIAKIAGIKLCESYNRQYGTHYRSVMPTNLFGPNDNFNLVTSHVIPAFIRKFHEAKIDGMREVEIWGTGRPMRSFMHVDDMADACVFVMALDDDIYAAQTEPMLSHLNVGPGVELSIKKLAEKVGEVVGFTGELAFNTDRPDGAPVRLLNCDRLARMGWKPSIKFEQGLRKTYQWYLENQHTFRT